MYSSSSSSHLKSYTNQTPTPEASMINYSVKGASDLGAPYRKKDTQKERRKSMFLPKPKTFLDRQESS